MKEIRRCKICGQEFYPIRHKQQCCCQSCRKENNRRLARTYYKPKLSKKPVLKKCLECGIEFATTNAYQKYCSRKCKKLHDNAEKRNKRQEGKGTVKVPANQNEKRKCKICGSEFVPKHNSEKCCSEKCRKMNQKLALKRWKEKHGIKPKVKKDNFQLTEAQIEQRERLKLELLRRRLLYKGLSDD